MNNINSLEKKAERLRSWNPLVFIWLPRSNKHGRKRSYTEKYGEKNDRLRSQYTEAIYGLRFLRFASFFSVYDYIAPYTGTDIYDRNTGPCNTTKYGRLRAYTDSVIVDLGIVIFESDCHVIHNWSFSTKRRASHVLIFFEIVSLRSVV